MSTLVKMFCCTSLQILDSGETVFKIHGVSQHPCSARVHELSVANEFARGLLDADSDRDIVVVEAVDEVSVVERIDDDDENILIQVFTLEAPAIPCDRASSGGIKCN